MSDSETHSVVREQGAVKYKAQGDTSVRHWGVASGMRQMQQSGMSPEQSLAIAEMMGDSHEALLATVMSTLDERLKNVATHEDLADIHKEISDIHKAISDTHKTISDIHKTISDLHKTVSDVHKAVSDVHKSVADVHRAMTVQTWAIVGVVVSVIGILTTMKIIS